MTTRLTLGELREAKDLDLGFSEWVTVDQEKIDLFAQATGDHQWIHVDRERSAQGPFGRTIAHGYLTLSLLPVMIHELLEVTDRTFGMNYGINRLRYTSPVPEGSRVRLHATVLDSEPRGDGVLYRIGIEIQIEHAERPALVGEVVFLAS